MTSDQDARSSFRTSTAGQLASGTDSDGHRGDYPVRTHWLGYGRTTGILDVRFLLTQGPCFLSLPFLSLSSGSGVLTLDRDE